MHRAIIAEDHAIVREGIALIVDKSDDFTVVAQVEDGNQLLEALQTTQCDLVLCDISMPDLNGLNALDEIKSTYSETKIVFITMHHYRDFLSQAIKSGVDGYVLKDDDSETILTVLRQVMKGHRCFSPRVQTLLADQHFAQESPERVLTKRELQVFRLTVKAFTNKEVSQMLNISVSTVEFHKKNIKDKLKARNLADLLNIAQKFDIQ